MLLIAAVGVCCVVSGAKGADSLALIPKPLRLEQGTGVFTLAPGTAIAVEAGNAGATSAAELLAGQLNRSTDLGIKVGAKGAIVLTIEGAKAELGPEGYTLDVTPKGVTIRATAGAGLFYGTQTLLQLLPPQVFSTNPVSGKWEIPVVRIEDQPRFGWRGMMLDVCRHFFNKDEVKNFIDLLARHKMNTFHWHLTDDQGWRIEIKKYPKLTEIGAWRQGIGFGLDPKAPGAAYGPDGRYGGFFTQDDIREVVAYAKQRQVTIVPEIEMPGHATAALAAYPEFSCKGSGFSTDIQEGVHRGVFCPGNEATFGFLQDVLTEVMALFPGQYVHIGGDETPKDNWKNCPKCQARKQAEGLKNEHELQSYLVRRIEKFISAHGHSLIGWSEIREGGLAKGAALMDWIGGAVESVRDGHNVVMTPTSHCYFDYRQAKGGEPKASGFLPLEKVYSFEPVPAALSADEAKHILGAGGNLWSEYFPNYRHVQYMAYPRSCAMAELTWTDKSLRNWDDFQQRLETHLRRLEAQGVNFRDPNKVAPPAKTVTPAGAATPDASVTAVAEKLAGKVESK